jgi:hypothetical protein
MSANPSAPYVERLDAVRPRLARLAEGAPASGAVSDPDPDNEERWDWGQVWAHVAEFPGYWMDQLERAFASMDGSPQPFGRLKTDPGRVGAIERDRVVPAPELWTRVEPQLDRLRAMLEGLTAEQWGFRAAHPVLGEMDMPKVLDRFLVGHLEEHAEQLEGLVDR